MDGAGGDPVVGSAATPAVAAQAAAPDQPALRVVTVGVYRSPPFVMETDGHPTGMAIELWESLATSLGLQSRYVWLETNAALVDALAAREVDVGVTNLAITRARAERIDFTHPWFDSGLRPSARCKAGASGP